MYYDHVGESEHKKFSPVLLSSLLNMRSARLSKNANTNAAIKDIEQKSTPKTKTNFTMVVHSTTVQAYFCVFV